MAGERPPFRIDPARLYEVGRDGTPHTDTSEAPEWLGLRHRRLLGWVMLSGGVVGVLAGLSALCLLLGARLWAAGFALAMLAAAPLVAVGPGLDWWRHRRPHRRRHRSRSPDFPPG
jgi:type IV secretory pathway TrbD component